MILHRFIDRISRYYVEVTSASTDDRKNPRDIVEIQAGLVYLINLSIFSKFFLLPQNYQMSEPFL